MKLTRGVFQRTNVSTVVANGSRLSVDSKTTKSPNTLLRRLVSVATVTLPLLLWLIVLRLKNSK